MKTVIEHLHLAFDLSVYKTRLFVDLITWITNQQFQTVTGSLTPTQSSTIEAPSQEDVNPFVHVPSSNTTSAAHDGPFNQEILQTLISQLAALQSSQQEKEGKEKEKVHGVGAASCSSHARVHHLYRSISGEPSSSCSVSVNGQFSHDLEVLHNGIDIDFDILSHFLKSFYDEEARELI